MEITSSNFKEVARKCYTNELCRTESEFNDDLNRVNHIVRSLGRTSNDNFNPRVLINQLIVFFNVFEVGGGVQLILFKLGSSIDMRCKLAAVLFAMNIKLPSDIASGYMDTNLYHTIREEYEQKV